jgi:very-long-chain enoyl-CoA reductase
VDEKGLSDVLGSDADGWELQVKDLGPQVSWKMVFVVEYVSFLVTFLSLGYPCPWVAYPRGV